MPSKCRGLTAVVFDDRPVGVQLDDAWPKGKTAMERYEIGCRHRDCLARIREIQESFVAIEAHTVAGAAVQLRRLEVMLDRGR